MIGRLSALFLSLPLWLLFLRTHRGFGEWEATGVPRWGCGRLDGGPYSRPDLGGAVLSVTSFFFSFSFSALNKFDTARAPLCP